MEYIDAETIILAPIGGTVIQRKIGLRQYIAGGGTDPVFTVGDLASVWLIANRARIRCSQNESGAPIEISVLAYPNRTFNAKVAYIAPALDPNTRRRAVRAETQNPDRETSA